MNDDDIRDVSSPFRRWLARQPYDAAKTAILRALDRLGSVLCAS
jgi:hypothetical protein